MAWKEGALDTRASRRTCRYHTTLSHLLKKPHVSVEGDQRAQGRACGSERVPAASSPPSSAQPASEQLGDFLLAQAPEHVAALRLSATSAGAACETNILSLAPGRKQAESCAGRIFSPPSSATQMRGKSLSQPLPFFPKSSQRRGTSQITYFCA